MDKAEKVLKGKPNLRSELARQAAELGYRYLQVDASPDSEPILRRLNAACVAALRAPEMQPRLQAMAVTPEAQPLEAWPAYFRAESDKWRDFVRARNIRVQ